MAENLFCVLNMLKLPCICVCLIVLFTVATGPVNAAQPPLDLKPGWNLVGMPCTVSADIFKSNFPNQSLMIFHWDNGAYAATGQMMRGFSYFVHSQAAVSATGICPQDFTASDYYSPALDEGWNMLGNPYYDSLYVSVLHSLSQYDRFFNKKLLAKKLWLYDNGKFIEISNGSLHQAKPWQGFIIHYEQPETTPPPTACSAHTDCDDGNAQTADTCIHPNSYTAQCLHRYTGNACADGSQPANGLCPDVWIYFEPNDCGGNTWEERSRCKQTIEGKQAQAQQFFADKYGIQVQQMRACENDINRYTDGQTPANYDVSMLVSSNDALTILASHLVPDISDGYNRYIDLDPIAASENPPPCVKDMGIKPCTAEGACGTKICLDGSTATDGTCPDMWVVFEPFQFINPWGHSDTYYPPPMEENRLIQNYFADGYGIDIKQILRASCTGDICFSACCGRGSFLALRVSDADAWRISNENLLDGTFEPGPGYATEACSVNRMSVTSAPNCFPSFCTVAEPDPACNTDADCDDGDMWTRDSCVNPGLMDSDCAYSRITPACTNDAECGDGALCNNPGGLNAQCIIPAACPEKTIICSHPQGCDTILWKKPDCTGDSCWADPPAEDYSFVMSLSADDYFIAGFGESGYWVGESERIDGRQYFTINYVNPFLENHTHPIDNEYLRIDDNWQLFYAFEITPCVFRETLLIPGAAQQNSTWDIYEPYYMDRFDTERIQQSTCRLIDRNQCSFAGYYQREQSALNYFCESSTPDGYDQHICYVPKRGIISRTIIQHHSGYKPY